MAGDSDDESDLLAALGAYSAAGAGSSSDSDDDGICNVDTSAVAQILAGRHSSDASNFGALADALQSVAAAGSSVALDELQTDDIQVSSPIAATFPCDSTALLTRMPPSSCELRGLLLLNHRFPIASYLSAALQQAMSEQPPRFLQ
jgi:hypothetical protein